MEIPIHVQFKCIFVVIKVIMFNILKYTALSVFCIHFSDVLTINSCEIMIIFEYLKMNLNRHFEALGSKAGRFVGSCHS